MATVDIATQPLSKEAHGSQLRRAVIASTVGTTIEWYDFLLYNCPSPARAATTGVGRAERPMAFGRLTHRRAVLRPRARMRPSERTCWLAAWGT